MRALLLLLLPAALSAQQITQAADSVSLRIGESRALPATLRGASGAVTYSGSNALLFTAHRDGRVTALAVGCGTRRASYGTLASATVRVCVTPRDPVPSPAPVPNIRLFTADFPTLGRPTGWPVVGGQGLEVIPATGLDFPTPNVLRVTALQATTGYAFLRTTGLGEIPVGQSRYYRWYFRFTAPDNLEDQESHPHQDGNASSQSNWLFHVWHNRGGAGRWTPEFRANTQPDWQLSRWNGPTLRKHQTYRFELRVHRFATNGMRLWPRIYTSDGTLLADTDAFKNDRGQVLTMVDLVLPRPAELGGLNAGLNGIAGQAPFPFVYGYQGGVAVCTDWCGRWVP